MEYIQQFFSWVWTALRSVMIYVINLLPDSPFNVLSNSNVEQYMGYFNWLFPVSEMVAILQVWVVAVASFYIFQALLRWVKAIE